MFLLCSNRLLECDKAPGPEQPEARRRQIHGWERVSEEALGLRRETVDNGSLAEASFADSAEQTGGATGAPGPSNTTGLSSLEFLKALVGAGGGGDALGLVGEREDGGGDKSPEARVRTLSIEAEEATRVPQVAQLLPTTCARHSFAFHS